MRKSWLRGWLRLQVGKGYGVCFLELECALSDSSEGVCGGKFLFSSGNGWLSKGLSDKSCAVRNVVIGFCKAVTVYLVSVSSLSPCVCLIQSSIASIARCGYNNTWTTFLKCKVLIHNLTCSFDLRTQRIAYGS